jgi:hypothetical protein
MGWMLTVLLVVLVVAYTFFLFLLAFVADIGNVDSLRFTAAFMLIAAVATFAVLMFTGSGTMLEEVEDAEFAAPQAEEEAVAPVAVEEAAVAAPAVCAECGQENPAGAKFCFECGASFASKSGEEPQEEEGDAPTD